MNETAAEEWLQTSETHRARSWRTGGTESHKPNMGSQIQQKAAEVWFLGTLVYTYS